MTGDTYGPTQWSVVEGDLGLICICLPLMGPLFGIRPKPAGEGEDSAEVGDEAAGARAEKSWATVGGFGPSQSTQSLNKLSEDSMRHAGATMELDDLKAAGYRAGRTDGADVEWGRAAPQIGCAITTREVAVGSSR